MARRTVRCESGMFVNGEKGRRGRVREKREDREAMIEFVKAHHLIDWVFF